MNRFLGQQFQDLTKAIWEYISTGKSSHSLLESIYFPKVDIINLNYL